MNMQFNGPLRIYNGFGITPTTNYEAAGLDFYIPYIKTEEQANNFLDAVCKSYNLKQHEIDFLLDLISEEMNTYKLKNDTYTRLNVLHLFLATKNQYMDHTKHHEYELRTFFRNGVLVFDDKGIPGVALSLNDTLLINSGIKVGLQPGTAGIFFNKSGKGNQGFDVRACVVDEDYSGYVHLSMAFTRDKVQRVYCGDKLTQMVILPVCHPTIIEETEETYNQSMQNSYRGDNAFGSSDIKH